MKSDCQLSQIKLEQIYIIKKERFLQLIRMNEKESKIIYIDEAIFKLTKLITKYGQKRNVVMAKEGTQITTMAAIICISSTQGLEGYCIKPRSINIQDLRDTIEYISQRNQLSLHRGGLFSNKNFLQEKNNSLIFLDIQLRAHQNYLRVDRNNKQGTNKKI